MFKHTEKHKFGICSLCCCPVGISRFPGHMRDSFDLDLSCTIDILVIVVHDHHRCDLSLWPAGSSESILWPKIRLTDYPPTLWHISHIHKLLTLTPVLSTISSPSILIHLHFIKIPAQSQSTVDAPSRQFALWIEFFEIASKFHNAFSTLVYEPSKR
jgi:hypothetical protein